MLVGIRLSIIAAAVLTLSGCLTGVEIGHGIGERTTIDARVLGDAIAGGIYDRWKADQPAPSPVMGYVPPPPGPYTPSLPVATEEAESFERP